MYNIKRLVSSVLVQTHYNFRLHLAIDKTSNEVISLCRQIEADPQCVMPFPVDYPSGTIKVWENDSDRLYAVANTIRVLDSIDDIDSIIGVIDADDQLCERRALQWVNRIYNSANLGAVWTSNIWEPYGINLCSGDLDDSQDVYRHPWVSSHFRTFKLAHYKKINPDNFKDENGEWMKRCEDQTFMLPIIHMVHKNNQHTHFLENPCYLYRGYQEIGGEAHQYQMELEKFIRNRGFVE